MYRLALIRKSNGTLKLSDYFELFPVSSHTLSNYFLPYTPPPCRYTGRTAEITGDGGSSNSSLLFFHIVSWSTFSSDVMDCHKSLICRYLQMLVALQKKTSQRSVIAESICTNKKHLSIFGPHVFEPEADGVWGGIVKVVMLVLKKTRDR